MGMVMLVQGKNFTFEFTLSYITSLFYLSTIGSVIAFGCYFTLLNKIGAHKASYASIMFPAVAVVISTFIEGFLWNSHTIIGFICMIIGNIVVLSKPKVKVNASTSSPIKPIVKVLGN
jgi:drug/metabolite transporter (DMT)-like permease